MNPQPKSKPARSPKYLYWIRRQPCTVCQRPDSIDAHHTESGGIATKGSDYSAIPLCVFCHRKLHDNHGKSGHWSESELSEILSNLQGKFKKDNP
jgi:hypothetical protein